MLLLNPFLSCESYSNDLKVGTGLVLPTKFHPPNPDDTPKDLFPSGMRRNAVPPVTRFIRDTDRDQFLIYTDGACVDNGGANPRAGCGVVYKPFTPKGANYFRFPLENEGPTGEAHPQTSNRAELRAVIAATRYRVWIGEGFNKLVIATDSEYVVEGATSWAQGWIQRGWKTSTGLPVKNRDLWECLLGEVERWHEAGLQIQFWRIPKELNADADTYAKRGAVKNPRVKFHDPSGTFV
ncbi:ribonuclease H-like protein [Aspergillus sclerotioniger CBS 115572]|uniref:ribonuclease H n=1 Tax=Aspergillus sclerotioniger CBS 115572 TaxID=1450535 RepID=A0A317UWG8_9EURO|nr:ribonuclease H-like protein [Aspergillus sclerotioniger CBS 115572]PWY66373.1 ribonuclease H-like protein [Aspergillus sclerotioniger CBS 115572]